MKLASQRWLHERTTRYDATALPRLVEELLSIPDRPSVAVVIPARDEESTVAGVVGPIAAALGSNGLVSELVVMDGASRDATASRAAAAGARVVPLGDVLNMDRHPGKGGAMWAALTVTSSDVVVYLDADVSPLDPGWVCALIEPLFRHPAVALVKGAYDRPVQGSAVDADRVGGRVTELVARPLLNLLWPELSAVLQPLAGECAARRSLLTSLPFATGYGVELGLLVDAWAALGLDGLAQVDLGVRHHRHHDDRVVARMSATVLHTALRRLQQQGRGRLHVALDDVLHQVGRSPDGSPAVTPYDVDGRDLPPLDARSERAEAGLGA